MEIALCSAVVFIEIAAASDLRPNIRNNCSRRQDRARHIVCLDCFNFEVMEVPPVADVWSTRKKKKSIVQEFSILIYIYFFLFIAFLRGKEGIIILAAQDREVNEMLVTY